MLIGQILGNCYTSEMGQMDAERSDTPLRFHAARELAQGTDV